MEAGRLVPVFSMSVLASAGSWGVVVFCLLGECGSLRAGEEPGMWRSPASAAVTEA